MTRAMTLTQKILAAHARALPRPWVQAGDVLQIGVDWTIASELAWNGMERTYGALGRPRLFDKDRFFLAVDHTVDPVTLATDARAQKLVRLSRSFARETGIKHFHDANQTILHTRFYRDLVRPGDVVLGADSHTSSHGGLGAFAIGLGGADVVVAMVLGSSWIEVPEAISVEYTGRLPFGLGGKDVILRTLGLLGRNTVAMERTVEYRGDGVRHLSTDSRFAIANMTAEFGGLNGIFEADEITAAWIAGRRDEDDARAAGPLEVLRADPDAPYAARYQVPLDALSPQIARPFSPDNVAPVEELVGLPLDGLFIGACTTTEEELVLAALVLEARGAEPRAPQSKQLVVPGDLAIEKNLREAGLWRIYQANGFRVGPPGCSMCLGIASEKAGRGEKWLSSQNRNYHNRMGEGSLAHLAAAATVAASAAEMKVADPRPLLARIDRDRYARLLHRPVRGAPEVRVVEPRVTTGEANPPQAAGRQPQAAFSGAIQRFGDHVDTDAIIPGEFCHLTALDELGAHAFHHVRPEFARLAREGRNIVVAGEAWGSGSSREQAVLALKGAGIQAVIARSYAFIHKRNLVNEALPFLVVRDAAFYDAAAEGKVVEVDLGAGAVHVDGRSFRAEPPSSIISALAGEGGIVPAIQRHGTAVFEKLTA